MFPLPQLLKKGWEYRAAVLLCLVVGLLVYIKHQQDAITVLHARPTVQFRDRIVEKRVIVRGPVRIVKDIVKAPDGTVTIRTTTDRSPETVTSDKDHGIERVETPPVIPEAPRRMRYVGLALNPFDHGMPERARAGLTMWDRLDLGAAWEPRRPPTDGGVQLELSYRF